MRMNLKRELHEFSKTVTFDAFLEECTEKCRPDITCLSCESQGDTYEVFWKYDHEYWCASCIRDFIESEMPEPTTTGDLRTRFKIFERDDFKCVYCGRNPREHETTLEIEHVFPKARGGTNATANLVTACKECNAGKGDYLLNQRQLKKFLDIGR